MTQIRCKKLSLNYLENALITIKCLKYILDLV